MYDVEALSKFYTQKHKSNKTKVFLYIAEWHIILYRRLENEGGHILCQKIILKCSRIRHL